MPPARQAGRRGVSDVAASAANIAIPPPMSPSRDADRSIGGVMVRSYRRDLNQVGMNNEASRGATRICIRRSSVLALGTRESPEQIQALTTRSSNRPRPAQHGPGADRRYRQGRCGGLRLSRVGFWRSSAAWTARSRSQKGQDLAETPRCNWCCIRRGSSFRDRTNRSARPNRLRRWAPPRLQIPRAFRR